MTPHNVNEDKTIAESNQNKQLKSPKELAEETIGWFNHSMNAERWFDLNSVTPIQAATLLHQWNPHDDTEDPATITNDETNPNDFKNLRTVFEDESRVNQKNRTLEQWRDFAIVKHLKYHSWIDKYLQARKDAFSPAAPKSARGMTKTEIARAFDTLHFNYDQWKKNLADPPKWLLACRVSIGSKGRRASAIWNPVLIAIALMDKKIPIKRLDAVFVGLKEWQKEWQEKTELMS